MIENPRFRCRSDDWAMTDRYVETFEVHLRRRGIWTVDHTGLTAAKARETGESAFRRAGIEGLRVVRCRVSSHDDVLTEDLMVERTRAEYTADAIIGTVDTAPTCQTVDDLLRNGSRLILHRLFGGWLRNNGVGPIECLVTPRLLRLVLDNTGHTRSALHHVSAYQTAEGEDAGAAYARLEGLIDQAVTHSRDLDLWVRKTVRSDPLSALAMLDEPDRRLDIWQCCTIVAAYLSPFPTRLAKVEALVGLIEQHDGENLLNVLDLFLTDYLIDDELVLELAGETGFLADRLMWIAGAVVGLLPKRARGRARDKQHAFAETLPGLIEAGRLPRASFALLQAVDAILRRDAPLSDGTTAREQAAVVALVKLLASGSGFAGGPRLAARLAKRYAVAVHALSGDSFLEAVDTIILGLSDVQVQVRFLLALVAGSNPPKTQAGLLAITNRAFNLYGGLRRLARRAPSAQVALVEFDSLCVLIENAYVDPKTRQGWTGAVLSCLDDTLHTRLDRGELSLEQLLRLAESTVSASRAVRHTLVRRLSRAAGIVT